MAKDLGDIDFSKLLKIANSPAGRELMNLIQKNRDARFDEAMHQAEAGDFSQAKEMLSQMLSTKEAQDLVQKIRGDQ